MTLVNVMILLVKLLLKLTIQFWHVETFCCSLGHRPHGEMKVYISLKVFCVVCTQTHINHGFTSLWF